MKTRTALLLSILTFSVVARVAVALYLGDVVDAPPLLMDQRSYHTLGARLITGYGFSFDVGWYPFTPPDTPTAHWSFLYSLFVATVYGVFGVHPLAGRLLQAVLGGILLPWMMYRLSLRLFEAPKPTPASDDMARNASLPSAPSRAETVALLAAGFGAVYAYFVLYAATLMTETFFIVVLLWSLERALAIRSRLSQGRKLAQARSYIWSQPGYRDAAPPVNLAMAYGVICLDALGRLAIGPVTPRFDRTSHCDGPHRLADSPLHAPELPCLWDVLTAQFQRGLRHVLGAASPAGYQLS